MASIRIPDKLNGNTFYWKILPSIYENIIKGNYIIDFDMQHTELANPEGLVNLLAAAYMIRSKSEYIPQLYLPESPNLFDYMRKTGFFFSATISDCEALKINYYYDDIYKKVNRRQSNYLRPQLFGLFTHSDEVSTFNRHINNIINFVKEISDSLIDKVNPFDLSRYCRLLTLSLVQVIKNSLEHNHGYKGTLAYYMIQKTPYNTIEFAFSDIGQGFLERMKKMLKEKDEDAIRKYGYLEQKLNNKDLLFKEHEDNPNLLSIINAVKFRENSEIPGLHQIKEIVLKYGGIFSIHSGNYSVLYGKSNKEGIEEKKIHTFHNNSYFSGCHLKIVINIP